MIVPEPSEIEGKAIHEIAMHNFALIPNEFAAHLLV
jgi:hypothetical protein